MFFVLILCGNVCNRKCDKTLFQWDCAFPYVELFNSNIWTTFHIMFMAQDLNSKNLQKSSPEMKCSHPSQAQAHTCAFPDVELFNSNISTTFHIRTSFFGSQVQKSFFGNFSELRHFFWISLKYDMCIRDTYAIFQGYSIKLSELREISKTIFLMIQVLGSKKKRSYIMEKGFLIPWWS